MSNLELDLNRRLAFMRTSMVMQISILMSITRALTKDSVDADKLYSLLLSKRVPFMAQLRLAYNALMDKLKTGEITFDINNPEHRWALAFFGSDAVIQRLLL